MATKYYKCHSAKYCRSEKEICGYCAAKGHIFKNCPNKSKNSVYHHYKKSGKPSSHTVTDKTCPSYVAALNQMLLRTDYVVSKNLGNGRELRLAQLNMRRSQYVTLEIVRVMEEENIYLTNGGVLQSKSLSDSVNACL